MRDPKVLLAKAPLANWRLTPASRTPQLRDGIFREESLPLTILPKPCHSPCYVEVPSFSRPGSRMT